MMRFFVDITLTEGELHSWKLSSVALKHFKFFSALFPFFLISTTFLCFFINKYGKIKGTSVFLQGLLYKKEGNTNAF